MKILLRAGILFVMSFLQVHSAIAQGMCPGFGLNGIASSLESHSTQLNALTVLSNGKIIAVGSYDDSGRKDMLVARYNANGTPDLTFSINGIRLYDLNDHANDEALCVAVAADGNILVGGISAGYGAVIKLDAAGKLVNSFGTSGKIQYGTIYSSVEDIAVSSEGNIYTVGKTFHTENIVFRRLSVQVYNSGGTLLTSFSGDGKYDRTDFLLWHTTVVKGALQPDGKLVIAGTTPAASNLLDDWFLVRLNTDGNPDNTFHADGLVTDPEFVTARLTDLAIGTNGSIYVGGYTNLNSDFPTLAVAKKFKPNGDSDNSFSMSGSSVHGGAGNGAMMHALAIDANENVYIAGSKGTEEDNHDLLIGAFHANGDHDTDFTNVDKIPTTTHGVLLDLVRLSDGTFVACGYAVGKDRTYGILRKYKANGTLETSFNASGANFIRYATDGETLAVAVQSDGKILAAGSYVEASSNTGIAIARFEADGSPDLSFGSYGYARYDLTARREHLDQLYVYPDGKILAGGSINDAASFDDYLVVRMNSDGSLDQSFGTNGFVKKHIGAYGKRNDLRGITVDSQGRILIAGDANYNGGSYQNATVIRLLSNGNIDTDFAASGVFSINLSAVNDYFQDVVVAQDGSIYAAGHGTINVGGAVVKINDAGELVTEFGTNGVFNTDWKEGYISRAFEIELQPDGKLLVGCQHEPKDGTKIYNTYVYRLSTSGTPDDTFGENGLIEFHFSSQRDLYGLSMDNAGLIYFSASADGDFYLAKINQNGTTTEDPLWVGFTSRAAAEINKTNGNVYAGSVISGGLLVACVGSTGSAGGDCSGVDEPTISLQGGVLHSSDADSYQWYSWGEAIEGETNQTLEINPVVGGVFSVEVTIGDCSLFSDDFEYLVTGNLPEADFRLRVFPNPTSENIMIESDADLRNATVSLHSAAGTRVHEQRNLSGTRSTIALAHLPTGLYILSIQSPNGIQRIKILKQN